MPAITKPLHQSYVPYYVSYTRTWLIYLLQVASNLKIEHEKHARSSPKNVLKPLPTKAFIFTKRMEIPNKVRNQEYKTGEPQKNEKHSGSSQKNALKLLPTKAFIFTKRMEIPNKIWSQGFKIEELKKMKNMPGPPRKTSSNRCPQRLSLLPNEWKYLTKYGTRNTKTGEPKKSEKHSDSSPKNTLKPLPTKHFIFTNATKNVHLHHFQSITVREIL